MHSVATRPAEPKLVEHRAIVNCRRRRSRSLRRRSYLASDQSRVEGVRGGAGDETTAGTRHLAVGYGMLAGEPKTQKTRTAEDSAVPVASGKPWLGRLETDPNDPINHPLHDGAELWLQICLSEGADPVEIAYPSLTDDERQERRECIAQDGAPQGRVLCRRRRGDRRPAVRVGRPDRLW